MNPWGYITIEFYEGADRKARRTFPADRAGHAQAIEEAAQWMTTMMDAAKEKDRHQAKLGRCPVEGWGAASGLPPTKGRQE